MAVSFRIHYDIYALAQNFDTTPTQPSLSLFVFLSLTNDSLQRSGLCNVISWPLLSSPCRGMLFFLARFKRVYRTFETGWSRLACINRKTFQDGKRLYPGARDRRFYAGCLEVSGVSTGGRARALPLSREHGVLRIEEKSFFFTSVSGAITHQRNSDLTSGGGARLNSTIARESTFFFPLPLETIISFCRAFD